MQKRSIISNAHKLLERSKSIGATFSIEYCSYNMHDEIEKQKMLDDDDTRHRIIIYLAEDL